MLNLEILAGKGLKALNILLPKFKTFNLIQKLCASYLMFLILFFQLSIDVWFMIVREA